MYVNTDVARNVGSWDGMRSDGEGLSRRIMVGRNGEQILTSSVGDKIGANRSNRGRKRPKVRDNEY